MSRVYKKILSVFGLALVAGITAIAAGIPPVQDAAATTSNSSNVTVTVTIEGTSADSEILAPIDGVTLYAGNGDTASINYANASLVEAYLTGPDGVRTLIYSFSPTSGNVSGTINDIPLNLTDYGEYLFEVEGEDTNGGYFSGDAIQFFYHAITASSNEDGTIRVYFGSAVCRLQFHVYDKEDTTRNNSLLEYTADDLTIFPGYPEYADVEIPGFSTLDGDREYEIVVSAYDCTGSSTPLEEAEVIAKGIINPPDTGTLNIFGLTITRTDYVITGIITFVVVAIFAFFLLRRKKSER